MLETFNSIPDLLYAGMGVLATVVGVLWREQKTANAKTESKLENCEAQHVETTAQLTDLSFKVGRLEGRQEGIEQLADSVIKEVRGGISKNDA